MRLLRQTIRSILLESFDSYDKLTHNEKLELTFMGHDKSHIDLNNNAAIAKAFQHYSEVCNMPLYRGVYRTETRILQGTQIGDTFSFGRVTSLSEKESIGLHWAKSNYGNMIELVPGARGFNLTAQMLHWYDEWKARNRRDFMMQDGEYQREVAEIEKEWLIRGDATYELLDISERDGVTVYKIEMV